VNAEQYAAKLEDVRWKLRRLEILERDKFTCQQCEGGGGTIQVHHLRYEADRDPWDYPDDALITLCRRCHELEHEDDPVRLIVGRLAKKMSFPKPAPRARQFEADRLWRFLIRFDNARVRRALMTFGGWLWKTGIHDMRTIEALVLDRMQRQPDQPYAYYAPGGPGRSCRTDQIVAAENVAEHERRKSADGFARDQ